MSDNPLFVYAAVYADRAHAEGARDQAREAHAARAWSGRSGRAPGNRFPPAVLGSAVLGAAAGGGIGHVLGGVSRGDAKELGEHLDAGRPRWS